MRASETADKLPDVVYAFPSPDSKGTWDMIRRAVKAGVPVHIPGPSATAGALTKEGE